MAQVVMLKHKETGLVKKGFFGFSWTTLFFGVFPALFRGDFLTFIGGFIVLALIGVVTMGIGSIVAMIAWAFMYNKYYTGKLLERGYAIADSEIIATQARHALGIGA